MEESIKFKENVNANLSKDSKGSLNTKSYEWNFIWSRASLLFLSHVLTLYAFYLVFKKGYWGLFFYAYCNAMMAGLGTTIGAHRLWTHRTFKAKWPLRVVLMICQTMAYQRSLITWCRDHRTHHKFTDTDADPHNSTRGFFFSHVGWLCIRKHPDVIAKGNLIDMSDIEKDPIARFQHRYYYPLAITLALLIPAFIPFYFFGYNFIHAFLICSVAKVILSMNAAFLVNSAAHAYGTKPYENSISSRESPLAIAISAGEGYHNYHHAFPWDYKAAEFGGYYTNLSKHVIELFAKCGLAYDLKTVSEDTIRKRILRAGDGTHPILENLKLDKLMEKLDLDHESDGKLIWGWNDKDMEDEVKKSARIIYSVQ